MKKSKRYENGGYLLDSEGNRVKSGSNEDIMTGSGREEAETQKRMKAAEDKLASEVQEIVKSKKPAQSGNAGMDERDRRMEAAEKAPSVARAATAAKPKSGVVTKEELAKSGLSLRDYMNKQKGLTRRDGKAPAKAPSKAQSAESTKADFLASQRKRSDTIRDLTRAEREAPAGTSALAKQKIAEAKKKVLDEYAYAGKADEMKGYVPRQTPGARAPKQTTGRAKPYMPAEPDMSFKKGGSVRGAGIAQRGVRKCKMV
jgi:hypothetical protein